MDNLRLGINSIFSEKRKFIIIGLTGRTGSGCTTVADFLTMDFKELSAPRPRYRDYKDDEERKYRITYDYSSHHWDKFYKIRIRDVISSFILEKPFNDFKVFCNVFFNEDIKKLDEIENKFDELHNKRITIKSIIEKNEESGLSSQGTYDFYFNELSNFTDLLKSNMDLLSNNGFISIFQICANNIRTSGDYLNKNFIPENINKLSQRTNALIKVLRNRSKTTKENVCIVIDSIRNPYEASFFKDRYSAFYLWAITTKEEDRKRRLLKQHNLNNGQIQTIDAKEYPKKLTAHAQFSAINLRECIQNADIYIYNKEDNEKGFCRTKRKILKYISLIKHPGLITPTRDERLMQIAFGAKVNSGCISRQVGAVVTDEYYSVKAIGWNNTPEGQTPCLMRNVDNLIRNEDEHAFSQYEKTNSEFLEKIHQSYTNIDNNGHNITYCFKDIKNKIDNEKNQVHTRALHAEENAFLQLAKYGSAGIKGGFLYTTASPCELCSKKAYQLGIKKVLYIDPYPGISESHIINCGSLLPKLRLFEGAIGRAYNQLYTPIIPYKNELNMLCSITL